MKETLEKATQEQQFLEDLITYIEGGITNNNIIGMVSQQLIHIKERPRAYNKKPVVTRQDVTAESLEYKKSATTAERAAFRDGGNFVVQELNK